MIGFTGVRQPHSKVWIGPRIQLCTMRLLSVSIASAKTMPQKLAKNSILATPEIDFLEAQNRFNYDI